MTEPRILVINPGSTSTKIALFRGKEIVFEENLGHSSEELQTYGSIREQYPLRRQAVMDCLAAREVAVDSLDAVVGRGGLLEPIPGGTYRVNKEMLADLEEAWRGQHASNLGGLLAHEIAGDAGGIPSFIVDPVVVDEMEPVARVSGMPELPRQSIFHALNQKAVARKAAAELGKGYQECSLVVAHLGGGISVGVHFQGRVVDVNNALDGDGAFSPERSGGVPVGGLMGLCFSGEYTLSQLQKKVVGRGGLVAYLGTNDAREVEARIREGDQQARLVYEALAYQVAKEIGAGATVLMGQLDALVLTGGLAHSKLLTSMIKERVGFLGRILEFPGEEEMEALAWGALRVLQGEEEAKIYSPKRGR